MTARLLRALSDAAPRLSTSCNQVVVYLRAPEDREHVLRRLGSVTRLLVCATPAQLIARLATDNVAAVVVEIAEDALDLLPGVAHAMDERCSPVIARCPLSRSAIEQVVRLANVFHNLELSLSPCDDIDQLCAALVPVSGNRSARVPVLEQIVGVIPPTLVEIVAAASATSERGGSVERLAAACGVSVRSLEVRLATAGNMPPKRLLMRMLALHAAWRLGYCGWPLKRIAFNAGFESPRCLAERIERATGLTIREFRQSTTFHQLVDQFRGDVARAHAPEHA